MPAIPPAEFPPVQYRITKGPDKLAFANALLNETPVEFTVELDDSRSEGVVTGPVSRQMTVVPLAMQTLTAQAMRIIFVGRAYTSGFAMLPMEAEYSFGFMVGSLITHPPGTMLPTLSHHMTGR